MISHTLRLFVIPFSILLSVSSCQTYGVVAENDVYVQTPSAVNLNENPNDMTSFNAYQAGRKGRFNTQYNNPGMNSSLFFGMNSPSMWGYSPFYDPFRPGMGFGNMYGNPYYGFHGMPNHWGHNPWGSPYGWGYPHGNFGWGYPNNGMHGWAGTGYGWYGNGWGGYGYSGYNPNGWGSNTGATNGGSTSVPQNVFTGPRRSLSAQSGRSSSYPSTFQGLTTNNNATKPSKTQLKTSQNRLDNSSTKSTIQSKPTRKVSSGQFVKPTSIHRENAGVSNAVLDRSSNFPNTSNGVNRAPSTISSSRMSTNRTNNYHPSPDAVQRGTFTRSQVQRSSGFSSSPSRGTFQASPQNRGSHFSSPSRNVRPSSPTNSRMRNPNGFTPTRSSSPGVNSRPSNSGFSNGSSRGSSGSSGVSRGSSGGRSSGSSSSRGNR